MFPVNSLGRGKQFIPLCSRCICRNQPMRPRPKVPAALHPTPPTRAHAHTHAPTRTHPREKKREKQTPHPRTHAHAHTYARTWACVYLYAITFPFCSFRKRYSGAYLLQKNSISFIQVRNSLQFCTCFAAWVLPTVHFFLILHAPNPYLYLYLSLKNVHFAKIIFVLYALQIKGF